MKKLLAVALLGLFMSGCAVVVETKGCDCPHHQQMKHEGHHSKHDMKKHGCDDCSTCKKQKCGSCDDKKQGAFDKKDGKHCNQNKQKSMF